MKDVNARGLRVEIYRGAAVVRLPEQTGWHNFPEIRDSLCRVMTTHQNRVRGGIVIDFTDTILVDTAGLVLLARTHSRARLIGCPLRIVVPVTAANLRHALHVIGLDLVLPPFATVEEAVAATGRPDRHADITRVLDQIRSLNQRHRTPLSPPDQGTSASGLTTTIEPGPHEHAARLRFMGTLVRSAERGLAASLASLIDEGFHHLVVELHTSTSEVGDVLSILVGTRWRVAALGGCLAVPVRPERLDYHLRQGSLEQAFAPCPDCAARTPQWPTEARPALSTAL